MPEVGKITTDMEDNSPFRADAVRWRVLCMFASDRSSKDSPG